MTMKRLALDCLGFGALLAWKIAGAPGVRWYDKRLSRLHKRLLNAG
jgi:hypothetical protein